MGIRQVVAVVGLMLACALAPAHAEKRVALVIGNGAYKNLPVLKNPPNDARDLAEALKALDFDVDLGVDLTEVDMQHKVTAFAKRVQAADVALAFFAGHGMQARDPLNAAGTVNYLLPVETDIREEADLGFMLTARDVMARLQGAGIVRILVLDACRDNPIVPLLARSTGRSGSIPRGLSREPTTAGTLIAYSTQPGKTADDGPDRNSTFVKALLAHIDEPGVDVRVMFADVRSDVIRWSNGAQTPETSDSLNGRFMFRKTVLAAGGGMVAGTPAQAAPAIDQQQSPSDQGTTAAHSASAGGPGVKVNSPGPEATSLPATAQQTAAVAPPVIPAVPATDPCSGPVTVSFPSRCDAPLTAVQERELKPRDGFRECENCPEMVVVPAGAFTMGARSQSDLYDVGPPHTVTIGRPFAVGKLDVTVDQFAAFVRETQYSGGSRCQAWDWEGNKWIERADRSWRNPGFAQDGSHPVVCMNWNDAKSYADWLAKKTGRPYRLLSEAEWEYAAHGRTSPGTYPLYWFGNSAEELCRYANGADQKARDTIPGKWDHWFTAVAPCNDGYTYTSPAGHYAPNAFGLYDMIGNAEQWTADCHHDGYNGAPMDGSPWPAGNCRYRMTRGGSWMTFASLKNVIGVPGSVVARTSLSQGFSSYAAGFRVARTLAP